MIRRLWRVARIALVAVLALILIVLVAVWAVLGTTPGSDWALRQGARLAGAEAGFETVGGSLLGRLELADLTVDIDDQHIALDRFILGWDPSALLHRRLVIRELRALGVSLKLPESPPQPGEPQVVVPELPEVSLPLAISVEQFEVTQLRVGGAGSPPVVDRVTGAISGNATELTVSDLQVSRGTLDARLDAGVTLTGEWPLDVTLAIKGREADTDLEFTGTLEGNVRQPTLRATATSPFNATAQVSADLRSHPPAAQVTLSWEDARVAASPVASPSGSLKASTGDRAFDIDLEARLSGVPGEVTRVAVTGSGALESFDNPHAFSSELRWTLRAIGEEFAGNASVSGDSTRIALDHTLDKPFHLTTRGDVTPAGAATRLDLAGQWRDLIWPPGASEVPASPEGTYAIAGSVEAFSTEVQASLAGVNGVESVWAKLEGGASLEAPQPFQGTIEWKAETAPAGTVTGSGSFDGNVETVRFEHRLGGPGQLETRGTVTLAPATALDVTGTLSVPRWPLDGDAMVNEVTAQFDVQGALDALATRVSGDLRTAAVGPVSLRLQTTIKPERIEALDLQLGVLEGTVAASGDLGFGASTRARLEVQARGLNPERLHPQAKGRLDARLTTDLKLQDDKPQGPVILHRLGGTLGGYPVSGEGRVEILASGFEAEKISLRSGDNTLAANGRMTDTLQFDLAINAPNLKQLWPGLEGAVKGEGKVSGTPTAPSVDGSFNASNVRTGDAAVRSASLEITASLAEGSRSKVTLRAGGIRAGGTDVSRANLDLDGTPEAHRLRLEADTSHGRFTTAAQGGLKQQTWSGRVDELTAAATALGDWAQSAPWKLKVSPEGAESDQACLQSVGARLCLQASRPASEVQQLDLELAELPVARFSDWLPPGLTINGDLEAAARASRKGSAAWQASATITPTPIRIRLDEATGGAPLELTLDETRLEARHDATGSQATLTSRIGERGSLKGNADIGPMSDAAPTLDGGLEATLPDLAPFRALVPALSELAGRLQASLDLGGTVNQPRVEGTVALEEASAGVSAAGIRLEDLSLRARADGSGAINLEGDVRSGGGRLSLEGDGKVQSGDWSARLAIKGEDFEAVKLIPVQALVSPDLEVTASPSGTAVRGSVHVPEATVSIKELPPDVVQVSDDEVIVGREQPEASAFRQKLDVKVDITLGPTVQISAFGLETRLEGGLEVAVAGTSPPTGRGTVTLRDGRFTAYGQDLEVRRGRLLFAGPLDNPGLDVRAVRDAGEVVAGIEVSGTAASISSRVFSEPPLPQAEALSWLLTGRGLSGASQSDGATMAGAALALGLEQGEQVTRQIGTSLGLDELSVAPGGTLEESNLVLGKSLSPRLYIQYALGVLGGQGSVKLNYKVTERISVEAESGKAQGADVLYRLER